MCNWTPGGRSSLPSQASYPTPSTLDGAWHTAPDPCLCRFLMPQAPSSPLPHLPSSRDSGPGGPLKIRVQQHPKESSVRAELFCAWASQCGSHGPCVAAELSRFDQCHQAWNFFNVFFIYLLLAALGLHCCTQAFSSCGAQASHCSGFSCCGARALGRVGFRSCGPQP